MNGLTPLYVGMDLMHVLHLVKSSSSLPLMLSSKCLTSANIVKNRLFSELFFIRLFVTAPPPPLIAMCLYVLSVKRRMVIATQTTKKHCRNNRLITIYADVVLAGKRQR